MIFYTTLILRQEKNKVKSIQNIFIHMYFPPIYHKHKLEFQPKLKAV